MGAVAKKNIVEIKIAYLKKINTFELIMATKKQAKKFLKKKYPNFVKLKWNKEIPMISYKECILLLKQFKNENTES